MPSVQNTYAASLKATIIFQGFLWSLNDTELSFKQLQVVQSYHRPTVEKLTGSSLLPAPQIRFALCFLSEGSAVAQKKTRRNPKGLCRITNPYILVLFSRILLLFRDTTSCVKFLATRSAFKGSCLSETQSFCFETKGHSGLSSPMFPLSLLDSGPSKLISFFLCL